MLDIPSASAGLLHPPVLKQSQERLELWAQAEPANLPLALPHSQHPPISYAGEDMPHFAVGSTHKQEESPQ